MTTGSGARPIEELAERYLAAVRAQRAGPAARLLRQHPRLARHDIWTAAAAGHVSAVAALLAGDPSRVAAIHGAEAWPPLAYACASRRHREGARHAAALRAVARQLLDAGASPNSHTIYHEEGGTEAPISVLYHACMSDHVALVELLLERGARTDDGESVYHSAQLNRRVCLERLVAHGADVSTRQQPYGNTPLYFLVGHRDDRRGTAPWFKGLVWLLEHGADPDVTSNASAEAPLHALAGSLPKPATARALMAHGADVNLPRGDGLTPYAIAVRRGNLVVAELLRRHGARTGDLSPVDRLLGACHAADAARARALVAEYPGLLDAMGDADRAAIVDAAGRGAAAAVRLMVALGFRVEWTDGDGATPLHWAAWAGHAPVVRLLLELGAPVNVRERRFHVSPLGWAAHGSRFGGGRPGSYPTIVRALVAAGADRDTATAPGGLPPEEMAAGPVARVLRGLGFGSGRPHARRR